MLRNRIFGGFQIVQSSFFADSQFTKPFFLVPDLWCLTLRGDARRAYLACDQSPAAGGNRADGGGVSGPRGWRIEER